MTRAAARVGDRHTCPLAEPTVPPTPHVGGPILPPGAPHTQINGSAAVRVGDRAHCAVPPADTVRGGLITVFIDGSPAARRLDKTDMGAIITASPDVLLGEVSGGPLTPFQAEWLYKYLNSQRDIIPFEYVDNGCEVRADRMCELMDSLGIPVKKQWLHFTQVSGKLRVSIPKYPRGGVTWDWHVAPIIEVAQPGGAQTRIIDPSLGFEEPVTVDEWIRKQTSNPAATVTGSTSKEVYRRGWDSSTESWDDSGNVLKDSRTTHDDLEIYRKKRAEKLPEESGRRIANHPVHY